MPLRTHRFGVFLPILVACRAVAPPIVATNVDVDVNARDGGAAMGEPLDVIEAGAAPCAAKIERSHDEPSVDHTAQRPTRTEVVERRGEYPARETVLLVPVDGGVVEHMLGSSGNPECDDSFTTTLLVGDGLAVAEWKRKQQRLIAMRGRDGAPCEEIGVGDCTLGCKDEGETFHLLVVDGKTGRRLVSIETERRPGEGIKPPDVNFDWRARRVTIRGAGCFESISLR